MQLEEARAMAAASEAEESKAREERRTERLGHVLDAVYARDR
jgi:hypothetical protein